MWIRTKDVDKLDRIIAACREWNALSEATLPREMKRRRLKNRSIQVMLKVAYGLFWRPNVKAPRSVVLFQGLRSSSLFCLFPKEELYIIGSWIERNYAKAHGYGFIPAHPVLYSLLLAIHRNLKLPARWHLRRWRRWISDREVTVVVYEDTQPIGTFLALLSDSDEYCYHAICIQHGHFNPRVSPYRPDGRLTEYNLTWSDQQADEISNRPEKTKVVGLPYEATAAPAEGQLRVLFIGLGAGPYQSDGIKLFDNIAKAIRSSFGTVKICYRPHPQEFGEPKKIVECERIFGCIDRSEKVKLLNGPRTLFIGEVSSLLYEAKESGHLTAFLPVDPNNIATGFHDITVDPENLDAVVDSIREAIANPPPLPLNRAAAGDPLQRFTTAVRALGILHLEART
jgi:hypothetical protein